MAGKVGTPAAARQSGRPPFSATPESPFGIIDPFIDQSATIRNREKPYFWESRRSLRYLRHDHPQERTNSDYGNRANNSDKNVDGEGPGKRYIWKPSTSASLKKFSRYLILLSVLLAGAGCGGDGELPVLPTPPDEKPNPEPLPEPGKPGLTSFRFESALNPALKGGDVECVFDGDRIAAHIRPLDRAGNLVPTFEGTFDRVTVDGREQRSGVTPQDFSRGVYYTLSDSKGNQRTYLVAVKVGAGLPVVRIDTDGGAPVASKSEFVGGQIGIGNIPEHGGDYNGGVRIRGRGNATWTYEKKPYRIKLDQKAPLMGFPAHRDWVLLAEHCDKSLLRNSYLWEMSRIAGMEWSCRSQHVELWLNGAYLGTYLLCENVKEGDGRIEVAPDGFIIERDNYWNQEPLWFSTTFANYTFKYPDPDGGIAQGDGNYNYIADFMRRFEAVLTSSTFTDPAAGYRRYIDAESFARWYLVQEVLGNIDTNPYYVMRERGGKLEMYPPWDAEWCLGCAAITPHGWAVPPAVSPVDALYWKENGYFARLIRDPWFCELLRSEWAKMKGRMPELYANIDAIADGLQYAQADNFKRWDVLGRYVSAGLLNFPTWRQETTFARDFLRRRIAWFDERIQSYPN